MWFQLVCERLSQGKVNCGKLGVEEKVSVPQGGGPIGFVCPIWGTKNGFRKSPYRGGGKTADTSLHNLAKTRTS